MQLDSAKNENIEEFNKLQYSYDMVKMKTENLKKELAKKQGKNRALEAQLEKSTDKAGEVIQKMQVELDAARLKQREAKDSQENKLFQSMNDVNILRHELADANQKLVRAEQDAS